MFHALLSCVCLFTSDLTSTSCSIGDRRPPGVGKQIYVFLIARCRYTENNQGAFNYIALGTFLTSRARQAASSLIGTVNHNLIVFVSTSPIQIIVQSAEMSSIVRRIIHSSFAPAAIGPYR